MGVFVWGVLSGGFCPGGFCPDTIRAHHCRIQRTSCLDSYLATNLTLKVLVMTIDAQWEGMGDVGSARYEQSLLPSCPTIRVLSYSS